ncbi:metal ion binding protein [Trypanosoma theileri]|uniref:Metal ion binding protein n=1 Tax=Trypanosoma theileri TaxID=67003 RepID=A0A1X0NWP0_9TRYP|nr:metal ion binding protein [Trypanosoma theileri]ORC89127.1 metal ion binding protein [Trypanosoma theileri]
MLHLSPTATSSTSSNSSKRKSVCRNEMPSKLPPIRAAGAMLIPTKPKTKPEKAARTINGGATAAADELLQLKHLLRMQERRLNERRRIMSSTVPCADIKRLVAKDIDTLSAVDPINELRTPESNCMDDISLTISGAKYNATPILPQLQESALEKSKETTTEKKKETIPEEKNEITTEKPKETTLEEKETIPEEKKEKIPEKKETTTEEKKETEEKYEKKEKEEEKDDESEVRRLEEEINRCNSRINRIQSVMARSWKTSQPRSNTVSPPSPLDVNGGETAASGTLPEIVDMPTIVCTFPEPEETKKESEPLVSCIHPQMEASSLDVWRMGNNNASVTNLFEAEQSVLNMTMGRMSMRSSSVLRVTDTTVAFMELLGGRRDVVLPSPSELDITRGGDILSSNYILKVDVQDALRKRKGPTGIIAGAPFFRMVPLLNIAGVAQPSISAISTVLNALRRAFDGAVVWVNLREEPLVYINNEAHIVRERKEPLMPMIIPNVTSRSIAQIEEKLKQEVLKEARENGGNISIHMEGKDGVMEDQWESADPSRVLTIQDVFNGLKPTVMYYRRPITRNVGPQPQDFDFVVDLCLEDSKSVIIYNCQSGRGKTSAMMLITSIVRLYQACIPDESFDIRLLRSDIRGFNFRTIKKIVSLIPDGKLHERRVMVLLELSDKGYSIAEHINAAFNTGSASAEEAIMHLQQYAYFLVFSYYCEQRFWGYHTKAPFSVWLAEKNELKLLITSIQSMEEEFKEERIVAPVDAGEEAWAASIVRHRKGNVLNAGRILCSVPMETEDHVSINALRQLAPDVPIFTCGRLTQEGRDTLVTEIRRKFPTQKRIQWISLRAEPMVFINETCFTLTDYDSVPSNPTEIGSTMHVSLKALEQIEERLRRDVILESQERKGQILLHRIDELGKRVTLRVKVCTVRTPKATMLDFAKECGIDYRHIPIPFSGHMLPSDIDPLLSFLSKYSDAEDVFIINDTEGATRTTVALNILTIFRASRVRNLRQLTTPDDIREVLRVGHNNIVLPQAQIVSCVPVNPEEVPTKPIELQVALTICQMLTAGSLLRAVTAATELGGRGMRWNILHALNRLKEEMVNDTMGLKAKLMREAVHLVRTYLLILLSTIYIDTMGDYDTQEPFSDWVDKRVEVANIIANLDQRAEQTLKYVETRNILKTDLTRRSGDVLTGNFALKADHFPGCRKKGLRPELCGAPNLRKVNGVNVYGVAIPTLMGIHNILSLLGASHEPFATYPGEQNDRELYTAFAAPRLFDPQFRAEELSKPLRGHVVWVNLREEPVLYVGDRPFVLRNLDAPYVNVELTGIEAQKVELVESHLLTDVLKEAENHDGMCLVSDEGNPGELVGIWETATTETVKTIRQIYNDLAAQGFRVSLLRLPVTDEQSPGVEDFDALVSSLLPHITTHMDRRETLSFVFNCQMGRGRTTTGMVICCLLIGLVMPEYYDELDNMFNPLYKPEDSVLSRGDYGCIMQLKRVLTAGRNAKHRVDLVIEACSQMQNLRTAIEAFAQQVNSPDVTEAQRGHAHHHGVHYLRRYFNLITFAAYLEEDYVPMKRHMRGTYADWLAQRPELTTLCETASLK